MPRPASHKRLNVQLALTVFGVLILGRATINTAILGEPFVEAPMTQGIALLALAGVGVKLSRGDDDDDDDAGPPPDPQPPADPRPAPRPRPRPRDAPDTPGRSGSSADPPQTRA